MRLVRLSPAPLPVHGVIAETILADVSKDAIDAYTLRVTGETIPAGGALVWQDSEAYLIGA